MSGDEQLTRDEAARRLDVSVATIDRYLARGVLTRYKSRITGRVWVSGDEVEQVRREREQGPK